MNQLELSHLEMENENWHSEERSMVNCVLENEENIVSSNRLMTVFVYNKALLANASKCNK